MAELSQFVFFDFEMLCSKRKMPYEDMEGIRLGAVKYDINTKEISYFDRYIRPTDTSPLSDFCKELTGIDDSDLQDANDFKAVLAEFLFWVGGVKRSRFFSWSKSDLSRLMIDAEKHYIAKKTIDKIEKRYVDFQAIFTKRVSKTNQSVENALALYGLEFEGTPHNPMFDAYNTLRIYLMFANEHLKTDLVMLKQFGFDDVNTLLETLKFDVKEIIENLNDIYKIRDAKKVLKRTKKIVLKYENILINRSGIFSEEILKQIRILNDFYQEMVRSFEEHRKYASKVMILHYHMVHPIKHLLIAN